MDFLIDIGKGVLIGLMVSIPLGPIGVIVIRRTLNKGWLSGLFSGLGAAFADLIYAIFAATGFGLIINLVQNHEQILKIITMAIIAVIGLALARKSVKKMRQEQKKSSNYISDFLTMFFLTFSNPLAIGVFLALFAGTSGENTSINDILITLLGILLGAILWWVTLTISVSLFRTKFRFRNLFWINRWTGIVIFILGIMGLCYALYSTIF